MYRCPNTRSKTFGSLSNLDERFNEDFPHPFSFPSPLLLSFTGPMLPHCRFSIRCFPWMKVAQQQLIDRWSMTLFYICIYVMTYDANIENIRSVFVARAGFTYLIVEYLLWISIIFIWLCLIYTSKIKLDSFLGLKEITSLDDN